MTGDPLPLPAENLRKFPLFEELTDADLASLSRSLRQREIAAGAVLPLNAELPDAVCFVLSGTFRMDVCSPGGVAVTFMRFRPGGQFGHVAALLGANVGGAVRLTAEQGGCLLYMSAAQFHEFVGRTQAIALPLMKDLAQMVLEFSTRLYEFGALDSKRRVVAELLRLAKHATEKNGGLVVQPAPTHGEIGASVLATREIVTRHLRDLEDAQFISTKRRAITIHDLEALRAIHDAAFGQVLMTKS